MTRSHVTILAIALSAAGCADLTISVDTREVDGKMKTMSRYHVERSRTITFRNLSQAELVVTPNGPALCEDDRKSVLRVVEVPPADPRVRADDERTNEKKVRICDTYTDDEFLYTAQIKGAVPEDPIVIIEN